MTSPALAAALAAAHQVQFYERVAVNHGSNARKWPPVVLHALGRAADIWVERQQTIVDAFARTTSPGDAIEILAETSACIMLGGEWWCVIQFHYVRLPSEAGRDAAVPRPAAESAGRLPSSPRPAGAISHCPNCGG